MSISDQQTALGQAAPERIKASHALEGDAAGLANFYRSWASSYDLDVCREEYCGPTVLAELASALQAAYLVKDRRATEILDAGSGTGLIGGQLKRLGFQLLDVFDLSDEMAQKAQQIRILPPYRRRCRPQPAAVRLHQCELRHYSLLRRLMLAPLVRRSRLKL